MIWDIIIDKIVAAGLGTPGQNLFEQRMPSDVLQCIGLLEPLDGIKIDPHMPGFYKPDLKIIVRHNEIGAGKALSTQLMDLLTITGEEFYAGTPERGRVMLKIFYPRSLPIQFPSLVGNTTEWSLNFQTAFTINA